MAVMLDGASITEIQARCRKHLTGSNATEKYCQLQGIPRNTSRQVVRSELFALWKNRTHEAGLSSGQG